MYCIVNLMIMDIDHCLTSLICTSVVINIPLHLYKRKDLVYKSIFIFDQPLYQLLIVITVCSS